MKKLLLAFMAIMLFATAIKAQVAGPYTWESQPGFANSVQSQLNQLKAQIAALGGANGGPIIATYPLVASAPPHQTVSLTSPLPLLYGGTGTIYGSDGFSLPILNCVSHPATVLFKLVKLASEFDPAFNYNIACATIGNAGDTDGLVGIAASGAGNSPNYFAPTQVIVRGFGLIGATFDGPTYAGDYVTTSLIVDGDVTDWGNKPPFGTQNLGRIGQDATGPGIYGVDLFPPMAVQRGLADGFNVTNGVTVQASSGVVSPFALQGASGQTAHLLNFKDFLGNVIGFVDFQGFFDGIPALAPIERHVLVGSSVTAVVQNPSWPTIDVNHLTLSTNISSMFLPAAGSAADGEEVRWVVSQGSTGPFSGPWTLPTGTVVGAGPLTAGAGTTLVAANGVCCPHIGTTVGVTPSELLMTLKFNTSTGPEWILTSCQGVR